MNSGSANSQISETRDLAVASGGQFDIGFDAHGRVTRVNSVCLQTAMMKASAQAYGSKDGLFQIEATQLDFHCLRPRSDR